MRIVNLIQRYPPAIGGAETWCREISRYLARRGHEMRVLTLDVDREEEYWDEATDGDGLVALGRVTLDGGVFVRRYRRSLPVPSLYYLLFQQLLDRGLGVYLYGPHSAEMYAKGWREIRAADVVVLHALPHPHNFVGLLQARLFRKPTLMVPHFHPGHPYYERPANYWMLRQCRGVLTVSDFESEYLRGKGISSESMFATGNGIHPDEFAPRDLPAFRRRLEREHGLSPDDAVISFLGRKTDEKGIDHLIEAVRGLRDEMPLRLFLAGPTSQWYERLYSALSARDRDRIVEMGVLSPADKVNLLHLSDLLALPSRHEAFGIVFLEAWMCGAAVVGTAEGAVPGVIGDCGFLVPFGDVERLRSVLRDALSDRGRLREMAARGRDRALGTWTWDRIGRRVEDALAAVTGGTKRGQGRPSK